MRWEPTLSQYDTRQKRRCTVVRINSNTAYSWNWSWILFHYAHKIRISDRHRRSARAASSFWRSTYACRIDCRPSFRRASSITSETLIVERPACLFPLITLAFAMKFSRCFLISSILWEKQGAGKRKMGKTKKWSTSQMIQGPDWQFLLAVSQKSLVLFLNSHHEEAIQ